MESEYEDQTMREKARRLAADGGRQYEVDRLHAIGPASPCSKRIDCRLNARLIALEGTDASQQVWKAFEIARLLDQGPAHDRRKPKDLRGFRPQTGNEETKSIDHVLVGAGAAENPVDAHRAEEMRENFLHRGWRLMQVGGGHCRHRTSLKLLACKSSAA